MSLILDFTRQPTGHTSEAMPSVNLTPNRNGYLFDHVEIHVNRRKIKWYGDPGLTGIVGPVPDDWKESGALWTTMSLDYGLKDTILQRRRELGILKKLRWADYMNFTKNEMCIQAYFKTGFTCANMVGYLLGYEDYYKLVPDDIWYRSLGYPIDYLA